MSIFLRLAKVVVALPHSVSCLAYLFLLDDLLERGRPIYPTATAVEISLHSIHLLLTMATGLETGAFILGIVPVIVEGIRLYKTIKRKTRIFKNCIEDVKVMRDELFVQEQIFINECLLLLQLGTDNAPAQAMVDNTSHPLWNDRAFNSKVVQSLQGNEQAFLLTIEGIFNTLQEIKDEISALDDIMAGKLQVCISAQPKCAQVHLSLLRFYCRTNH